MNEEKNSRDVVLQDVHLQFEDYPVLDGVSARFPAGKTTIVMGPSGSGKSTLLKAASGLVPVEGGKVFMLGKHLASITDREERELRRRNGFVFQDGALWQNLTVYQNLALPLQFHFPGIVRAEVERRISHHLHGLGFDHQMHLRPAQISIGERKIISFFRALILDPELIFMDEPTSSVDHNTADRMIRTIRHLRESGKTMIIATHSAELTSLIADDLLVMKAGKVIEHGPLQEVVRSTQPEVTEILTDVLSQTATYDGDILKLLDPETDPFS